MTPGSRMSVPARVTRAARGRLLGALAGAAVLALTGAAPALAEEATPAWRIDSEVAPSYLPPEKEGQKGHEGEGVIVVSVSDLGDGPADGAGGAPVIVTDTLPSGLTATSIESSGRPEGQPKPECSLALLRCTYKGVVNPYQRLAFTIKVKVEEPPGTVTTLENKMSVEGGGALRQASNTQEVTVSGEPTPFGVQAQSYELGLFNDDGTPATQAGSHPFQLTTTLVLNQIKTGEKGVREPAALPRNLRFALPPGLIGDPNATEQCPMAEFNAHKPGSVTNLCPPGSAVGVANVTVYEPTEGGDVTKEAPVFNLVPSEGEPARFGFEVLGIVPIVIDTSVPSGGDYGVVASVNNATELAGLLSSQVTFWGVPGDPRHDQSRGWGCVGGGTGAAEKGETCPAAAGPSQQALLTLPTSCAADPAIEPLSSSVEVESWAAPGFVKPPRYVWSGPLGEALGLEPESCTKLPFAPSIGATPEAHAASTPTGLTVDVKVPQETTVEPNPEGRAEADVKDTTVTLPEGVQLSPSAANGLEACREKSAELPGGTIAGGVGFEGFEDFQPGVATPTFSAQFDFTPPAQPTTHESFCPNGSKVGTVRIKTPLLPRELEGAVYLAEPAPNGESGKNPFNSLIALYIVAEDKQAGVLVKLAGRGELNQATGQITTTFQSTPQLPFEELKLELFGGERASLSTPPHCGNYATETKADFTAWSGATAEPQSESPFSITTGAGGGACPPGPLAFAPAFDAQSANTNAGAFSPFTVEIVRPDGDQALTGVEVRLPAGVAALLSSLTPCQEPPAGQEWACGEDSLIGHSTAWAGLGNEPFALPGKAYLTTGYDGAPFGLLVQTPATAGPFELGMVNVRSRINVNRETAAVTITTDPGPHGDALPTFLKGVPAQLKRLLVSVDREHFSFNPTNCNPMKVEGTLTGSEGTGAPVSSPFQVGNCASLPFAPKLTASAGGKGSKLGGTSLEVKIEAPAPGAAGLAQANIAKVDLQLPAALPSRLETLQKACLEAVFNANPASCDEGSVIGTATVHTPVLKSPLSGPAYLVSHGGGAFPDVEFVLQGEGITLVLDGKTDIKERITYSKFESAPDAPFTLFETKLPAGPHSALTANVPEKEDFSLCRTSLSMPTTITAQNGEVIEQDTNIAVTGCGEVESFIKKKPTRAQLLANALKTCRSRYRHKRGRRVSCEKQARRRYGPKKTAHKTTHAASHSKRS